MKASSFSCRNSEGGGVGVAEPLKNRIVQTPDFQSLGKVLLYRKSIKGCALLDYSPSTALQALVIGRLPVIITSLPPALRNDSVSYIHRF